MSQSALGETIGRSQAAISEWEAGVGEPTLELIEQVAATLGVRAGWLAFGEEPMYPTITGTANVTLPLGVAAAGTVGASPSVEGLPPESSEEVQVHAAPGRSLAAKKQKTRKIRRPKP